MLHLRARAASLAAALTLLAAAVPALAQAPQRIIVTQTTVKPDHWLDYLDLQKSTLPAVQKSGVAFSSAWEPAILGEMNVFIRATPLTAFNMFDGPSAIRKAMGEEAYQSFVARLRPHVVQTKRTVEELRPDLSIMSGRSTPPVLGIVVMTRVVPGKAAAFEALIRSELIPAFKKIGVKDLWYHRTLLGGDTHAYTALYLVENFAELDAGPPLIRAMGPEGAARYQEKLAGIVASQEVVVMRHRADLSYSAPRP